MAESNEGLLIEEVFVGDNAPTLQYFSLRLGAGKLTPTEEQVLSDLRATLQALEARLTSEPVQADGADMPLPPIPVDAKPTSDQKVLAMVVWDDTIGEIADPSYKGLLDAEPFDPDAESEETDNG